uniref:Polyprotein n=1 Tax=Rhizoctonia solani hypovirus Rs31 TaxID=3232012 RepID=A0AAU8MIY8_9VIRU
MTELEIERSTVAARIAELTQDTFPIPDGSTEISVTTNAFYNRYEYEPHTFAMAVTRHVRAIVTCVEEEDPEKYAPPKTSDAIIINPEFDPDATVKTLIAEACEELENNPELYDIDDFVLHSAILAEGAKEQGMPEDLAYHGAVLALHDFVMSYPIPDEVSVWRQKFAPVRNIRNINEYLQRFSIWIHSNAHKLPIGLREFLFSLYRWIEGVGAKLKTYAIKIYHGCVYIGDRIALVSTKLWEEFSDFITPLFDYLFGGKMSKRVKAVWALGGVARNPSLAHQRRLQESYAFAKYERHQGFNQAYKDALDDIVKNLPADMTEARLFPQSKYAGNLIRTKKIPEPLQADFDWLTRPREQYRPANAPPRPVMGVTEAIAAYMEKDQSDPEVKSLRASLAAIERDSSLDEDMKQARIHSIANDFLSQHRELSNITHDAFLTRQVAQRLERGSKQTVDHVHEVKRHPGTMFEMQERYAYLGLKFDPKVERIPDTFDTLSEEKKALYDDVARHIVAKWPERYQNRKLTSPEALMNYLEWDRGAGPMFEMSWKHRQAANAALRNLNYKETMHYKYDTTTRFRMWESGLGAAVLRQAYADAKSGKVDVQQFGAFVKSQPTPVSKLARGVTFMPITQWFKGMMECFAQNQRVTGRTTYIGKNMPGGAHMREFFEKVRQLPVLGEGDATQMDSRFEAGILYGLGRIAHHAWTWGSPSVENGAAIASHKSERYKALADGWILNLHVGNKDGLKPRFHLVNALTRLDEGKPVEIEVKGQRRFFFSKNANTMRLVQTAVDQLRQGFDDSYVPTSASLADYIGINEERIMQGARLDPSVNCRPLLNNVTQKIRGGATGLEDTTDLNTDGKKIGTIAALVTFGRLIGHPISVSQAMDEANYIEAHTSDDNIFGIDPLRLYGITAEEFTRQRPAFMQAFAENNLIMTFLFHEGEENGVRGRYLEYLSYFSRPLTLRDRANIQAVNSAYTKAGIFGPDKKQSELLDPLSGLPPTDVVYINTKAMDARQTAQNAYKQHDFRDRYLLATVQRDIGQAQLKAFNFQSYCVNLSTYHTNAVRYLAGALEPKNARPDDPLFNVCRHPETRTAILPTDPELRRWIESHFHPQEETAGGRQSTYVRYRIDGNVMTKSMPASLANRLPAEFRARLQELKQSQFPAYQKVVYDYFKPTKTPLDKADRIWKKINKGVLGSDEAIKDVLNDMRRVFEKMPKKFTRGITPTLDMVHPDEIFSGSGRVEASIYTKYETDCNRTGTMPTASGYQRLVNRSPYAGCCNAMAAFHDFNTPDGWRKLHEHPDFVYRNATVAISIMYGFTWLVERFILAIPFLGTAWYIMMFYLIDISKCYAVLGLLRWHTTMDADPYIAGLMPRDVYIHSKRASDWLAGFIPIEVFYILRFDLILDPVSETFSRIARILQHAQHTTPMTSTQPGAIQNEWEPVAASLIEQLIAKSAAGLTSVVSVKGPTGTGKSTFLVYALMRLWLMEKGGKLHLVAPFNVLRDDWSLPSWFAIGNHDTPEAEKASQYQVLKGNVALRPNAKIYLSTYGHFQQRIQSGEIKANDLVCMDEGHLGGPAQVMVQRLLEKHGISFIYLSATPAQVKGLDQGELFDATEMITQKNRKLVVTFPESTPQISMYQQMLKKTEKDPQLGFSHREMAQRCIMKVNTYGEIAKTIAALDEERKNDPEGIPMAFEFSSNTFKSEKAEREAYCAKGRYIIVATDVIGVGYDIKPPAYSIIDNGLTIQEHQGYLQRPMNSTRDQMEQFHGRVGRNSSDRNGLVYCTENAGTGIQAQQYGSGSYYVHEEVCKAIGVPQLRELPYQGCMRDFNYFDIKPDIVGPLRSGLIFTFLAALSGVDPREMPVFYRRFAEQGFSLPEEYEWLSARMLASGQTLHQVPAWAAIATVMLQDPFIVRIEGNQLVGRTEGPEKELSCAGAIYPRAGQWMSYHELSRAKNTVRVKAKITTEGEAFEAIRAELEKENQELRDKLAGRRAQGISKSAYLATQMRHQLDLRNNTARLAGVTAAATVTEEINRLKPRIAASIARNVANATKDALWDAGLDSARVRAGLQSQLSEQSARLPNVKDAVKAAISEIQAPYQIDQVPEEDSQEAEANRLASRAALDNALSSFKSPAYLSESELKTRKEQRRKLNDAYRKWMSQTEKAGINASLTLDCWKQRQTAIVNRMLETNSVVVGIRGNEKKGYVMQWKDEMSNASASEPSGSK